MKNKFLINYIIIFLIFLIFENRLLAQEEVKIAPTVKAQSLDDITAELEKIKKEQEPFSDDEIKIDLESLGLDDVSKKDEIEEKQENKSNKNIENDKKNDLTEKSENKEEKKVDSEQEIIEQDLILGDALENEFKQEKNELDEKNKVKETIKESETLNNDNKENNSEKDADLTTKKQQKEEKNNEPLSDIQNFIQEQEKIDNKKITEKKRKEDLLKAKKEQEKKKDNFEKLREQINQNVKNIKFNKNEELKEENNKSEPKILNLSPTVNIDKKIEKSKENNLDKKNIKNKKIEKSKNNSQENLINKNEKIKKNDEKIINKQQEDEKFEKEKMMRLNILREKYLIKLNGQDDLQQENIVIPHEKTLKWGAHFTSTQTPPSPILEDVRASDNKHIPLIITPTDNTKILFDAISRRNINAFNNIYRQVVNPNVVNEKGETLLTYAIIEQRYEIITSILNKGADPDLPNARGHTPLDIAIAIKDLKSAQILVDMKANINYIDKYNRTYLMHAVRVGYLPIVQLLVENGAEINALDSKGHSALSIAYRHRKEIIAKYLIKNGAKKWLEKPFEPSKQNLIKELKYRWQNRRKLN